MEAAMISVMAVRAPPAIMVPRKALPSVVFVNFFHTTPAPCLTEVEARPAQLRMVAPAEREAKREEADEKLLMLLREEEEPKDRRRAEEERSGRDAALDVMERTPTERKREKMAGLRLPR